MLGGRKIEIIAIDTKTGQQESAKGAQQILAEGIPVAMISVQRGEYKVEQIWKPDV